MNHRALLYAAKHINKRTLHLLAAAGAVLAACAAVMSFLGALLMIRQLQLVSAQKKALPVLQRAAQLYLDQNAPEETPARRRRKFFRLPRLRRDRVELPVTVEEEEGEPVTVE